MSNRLDRRPSPRAVCALLALLLLAVPCAWAGDLGATLDRTRVRANETLTLTLSAAGTLAGTPDFSSLAKDFEILQQGSSTSLSFVNGVSNNTREWTLELAPRRTGRLQVPALSLGGQQTQPIALEVLAADQADPGGGPKPVFVDTLVETAEPYVQQPFTYRVRVLFRDQPRRAILDEPQVEGATLQRQGEDQNDSEEIDGQRYTVIERRYLVVPQRSGPLTIGGPRLEALMAQDRPGARRSPFADFGTMFGGPGIPDLFDPGATRRVIERGPDRTLEVRPQPDTGGATWLPAESVQLSDEWTPSPPRFRVGEPVTRTLVITARGATAAQLPTLDTGTPEGARIYPETPKMEDLPGSVPTALKTLKVALVPTRAGPLTLPEIRLTWWDTTTDQSRVAVIPQRTVEVAPAAGGSAAPTPAPAAASTPASGGPPAVTVAPTPDQGVPAGAAAATQIKDDAASRGFIEALRTASPWPWLALCFALAWLLTLAWAIRRKGARASRPGPGAQPGKSLTTARTQARQACAAADPRAARTALLDWARTRWPDRPPAGLSDLAARLGPAASAAAAPLQAIDRAIYAPTGATWDGSAVWQTLEPLLLAQERAAQGPAAQPLPGLYPGT
ncbi:BatD family protein [Candidatus Thiodictyon syntrophicum]|jgi:hypothetical protein|uniref:DUF7939 domain-containing protein n=1 Tax=Candidatus Thiodictyon syntrophicum TaxID=1166950 RepID=A0A2K8U3B7_9GAMM|nr:BatD family protein [Candidatus Thiodictyon syntrophicum]AUB80084.1 hypothetical protein THSYN_03300 [Candidatus Thiodictyon syntrophicum]